VYNRKIPEIIGVDAATIRLLDASGKNLKLKAAYGLSQAYLARGPWMKSWPPITLKKESRLSFLMPKQTFIPSTIKKPKPKGLAAYWPYP